MIRSTFVSLRGGAFLLAGALVAGGAFGDEQGPHPARVDVGKGAIEVPTERLIAGAQPAQPTNRAGAVAPAGRTPFSRASAFANPKVEPGKVRWHADFAAARAAAQKSYKPVLLFQLMGKLDEQFC